MPELKSHLLRVRTIADYQFGRGAGEYLFPDSVEFQMSTTDKVRQIMLNNNRLATIRAHDGMLTLGIEGARKLHELIKYPRLRVVVNSDAAPFVAKGKTAFAKHIVSVDAEIRAGEEILVVDENDRLLASGKALLSPPEMLAFKKGIAVDIRWGVESGDRDKE
ncbi:MAG: pseudouridine synthase [Candidatus Methanoperedens sp.]|nr:pseudouridine synthase [Candidatus Methanoperedens sp.]